MNFAQKVINELLETYTQPELAEIFSDYQSNISAYKDGKRSVSKKVKAILNERFGYDLAKLNQREDDFLSHISEPVVKENPTTKEALNRLDKLRSKKENGKPKNINEGILENPDQLVAQRVIDVPIKGFAGLQKAFFSDDYIQNHFVEVVEYVKPEERIAGVYFRVKVEKNNFSMVPTLNPDETTWSEPISDMLWNNENIFKEDKVYSLWHPYRGILFKRIIKHNIHKGLITLSSDNEDKETYQDEEFSLSEFRKILIVRKKEVLM